MSTLVTIIHVLVCVILMITVLLQSGKGGMGAAFGGGGNTGTVFGGSGAGSFLRKFTAGAAFTFMLTSIVLAYLASASSDDALRRYSAALDRDKRMREDAKQKAKDDSKTDQPDAPQGMTPPGTAPDESSSPDEGTTPDESGSAPTGDEATPAPAGATDGSDKTAPAGDADKAAKPAADKAAEPAADKPATDKATPPAPAGGSPQ